MYWSLYDIYNPITDTYLLLLPDVGYPLLAAPFVAFLYNITVKIVFQGSFRERYEVRYQSRRHRPPTNSPIGGPTDIKSPYGSERSEGTHRCQGAHKGKAQVFRVGLTEVFWEGLPHSRLRRLYPKPADSTVLWNYVGLIEYLVSWLRLSSVRARTGQTHRQTDATERIITTSRIRRCMQEVCWRL